MIKLVIFDLDGTLVNAYPAVSQSVNYTLNALGLPKRSHLEIKRSVGGGDRKLMIHFAGEALADAAIAIYRPHHTQALQKKGAVRFLPGALSVLKFLKSQGYLLAIASNRPTKFTHIILKGLAALDYFDVILCADKAEKPKPYPHMLLNIASCLSVDKSQVLYVGDMIIDVECGQRAGIRMVAVATGSNSKKELKALKPWRIISKMIELKKIIKSQ